MYDTTECIQVSTTDTRPESERRRAPQNEFDGRYA